MRIQEMRSGISHLKKKMGNDVRENYLDLQAAAEALSLDEARIAESTPCELDQPLWSVVSFDQREAGGLTYSQAVHLMSELDANEVRGLCVVTDAAATRVSR